MEGRCYGKDGMQEVYTRHKQKDRHRKKEENKGEGSSVTRKEQVERIRTIKELPATNDKTHINKYLLSLTTLSNCIYPFRVLGLYIS